MTGAEVNDTTIVSPDYASREMTGRAPFAVIGSIQRSVVPYALDAFESR
jgi:hypothetical protein